MAECNRSIGRAWQRASAEVATLAAALACGSGLLPESAAALTVCDREKGITEVDKTPAELPLPPVPRSARAPDLTKEELESLKRQMHACFKTPPVYARVRMRVAFGPDGSVLGPPYILNPQNETGFRLTAAAGCQAVFACQPYDLPPEKYPTWSQVIVNFVATGG